MSYAAASCFIVMYMGGVVVHMFRQNTLVNSQGPDGTQHALDALVLLVSHQREQEENRGRPFYNVCFRCSGVKTTSLGVVALRSARFRETQVCRKRVEGLFL